MMGTPIMEMGEVQPAKLKKITSDQTNLQNAKLIYLPTVYLQN
jgi:hypothetical protein